MLKNHGRNERWKRPRRELTLGEKYEIATFMEKNPTISRKELSKQFSVPGPTLTQLAANVSEIKKLYEENKFSSGSRGCVNYDLN